MAGAPLRWEEKSTIFVNSRRHRARSRISSHSGKDHLAIGPACFASGVLATPLVGERETNDSTTEETMTKRHEIEAMSRRIVVTSGPRACPPGTVKNWIRLRSRAITEGMSEEALRTMQQITSTWVEDGYPNYQVWWFKLRQDDRASAELMALGLIEPIGIWRSYKLTREGQYWALQNRELRPSFAAHL
jgi:hypothetical protein